MMTSFRRFALAAGGALLLGWLAAPVGADVAYVSYLNGTVEQYSRTGVASVFASGVSNPVGLAFDHAGNLYVVSKGTGTIEKFTAGGVGSAFASGLDDPAGLAFDSAGNLYVANEGNSTIERFTPGGVGSVFASSGLSDPVGLAFDSAGNLYAANANYMGGNYTIEKFTSGGVGSVFASSGLAIPNGLAFDSAGNLYVANVSGCTIERFTPAGVGSVFANALGNPVSLAFDSAGNLYATIYNSANATVEKFTTGGVGSVFTNESYDPWGLAFTNDAGVPLPVPPTTHPLSATITLSSAINATIIKGGTGTLGVTIGNGAAAGANNLNYSLSASVQSGSATLGLPTPNSGSLAPSANQSCTVSATSTNLGINTISFNASDPNASNSPQTTTATLAVLDHSNASLSPTANQTTQTMIFGNLLEGASVPSQTFTIYNRPVTMSAAYTAGLKLTGFTATGDPALSTNLAAFSGLAAGGGNTYTASLNTSTYSTTGTKTITMSASQLADDSPLSGAGSNNNGAITVVLQCNVGNATADASNSQNAFGTPLTAPVSQNMSYANLASKVTASTGSGGQGMVGSTATLLAGTNGSSASQTVSMAWRTRTQVGRLDPILISDVMRLSGMALDGTSQTSPFVLEMTYNPSLLPLGASSEGPCASNKQIYLAWLDPNDGKWENAIMGNIGANLGGFQLGAWPAGDMTLGDWGVDTTNHVVWAVLDHNSDFSVVPEPSTLALLGVGAISLTACGWWRRRRTA
jgi:sugar lactone lactonase YvrE